MLIIRPEFLSPERLTLRLRFWPGLMSRQSTQLKWRQEWRRSSCAAAREPQDLSVVRVHIYLFNIHINQDEKHPAGRGHVRYKDVWIRNRDVVHDFVKSQDRKSCVTAVNLFILQFYFHFSLIWTQFWVGSHLDYHRVDLLGQQRQRSAWIWSRVYCFCS